METVEKIEGPVLTDQDGELPELIAMCAYGKKRCRHLGVNDWHYFYCAAQDAPNKHAGLVGGACDPGACGQRRSAMGLQLCIGLSALASVVLAMLVWVWLGPFAGAIASGFAFYAGCMVTLMLLHQGRT